jgi:uncharacterized protein (DUF1330 family)
LANSGSFVRVFAWSATYKKETDFLRFATMHFCEFPDLAAIQAWYDSPEHAPLLAKPAATVSLPLT